ncbi:MAG: endonuclease/exonuclease/phosphatase family metal-dependent hydrolase [Nitriliruptoraceae bacterium]|jgi:endonuclease/exonuclease/phosphatase family metal-dependent hydrolase
MTGVAWDAVLDDIEHAIRTVEDAMELELPIPDIPAFVPPSDVMPRLSHRQRGRAEALMHRQASVEVRVSAEIVSTHLGLGEVRRRRRAALAYTRA